MKFNRLTYLVKWRGEPAQLETLYMHSDGAFGRFAVCIDRPTLVKDGAVASSEDCTHLYVPKACEPTSLQPRHPQSIHVFNDHLRNLRTVIVSASANSVEPSDLNCEWCTAPWDRRRRYLAPKSMSSISLHSSEILQTVQKRDKTHVHSTLGLFTGAYPVQSE
jgi:hypothetical protein